MVSGGSHLEEIFHTMAYNEKQIENFNPILNWLSSQHNVLTSIVDGSLAKGSTPSSENCRKFEIGGKAVSVHFLDGKSLKSALMDDKYSEISSKSDKDLQDRLSKFRELLEKRKQDLCLAESITGRIPVWQLDQSTWSSNLTKMSSSANENFFHQGGQKRFILLTEDRISHSQSLLQAIIPAFASDAKYTLAILIPKNKSCSNALLASYLIDIINNSGLRKKPIDLFILDESSEEIFVDHKPASLDIDVYGGLENLQKLKSRIISGVFSPSSQGRCWQFIIDSSGDIQTTVETISKTVWNSGSKMNGKARSLLFVHEPIHIDLIEGLKKKINSLRINSDLTIKSLDFINKNDISVNPKDLKSQGIKIIPENSDFNTPTLLYDIGTSCSIVSSPTPGLGHILILIPYRSTAELYSLANNNIEGYESDVILFASNVSMYQEVARNLKGSGNVWVNSCGYESEQIQSGGCSLLTVKVEKGSCQKGVIVPSDESMLLKKVDDAEKALKNWSSLSHGQRLEVLCAVYVKTLGDIEGKSEAALGDLILSRLLRTDEEKCLENKNNMSIRHFRPFGLAGVVLVSPEEMILSNYLAPILATLYRGNCTLVLSLSSKKESSIPSAFIEATRTLLPAGVVQFCHIQSEYPATARGLELLGSKGKVPLLWIIHPGGKKFDGKVNDGILARSIPANSFAKIIVDTGDTKNFVSKRVRELDSMKVIHL